MTASRTVPFPRIAVLAALILSAAACTHAQVKPEADVAAPAPAPAAATQAAAPLTPAQQFEAQGQAEIDAALAKLRQVRLFFEFDSATLTPEAGQRLADVATVLTRHPELKVRIEGNCDERGTEQYNLALGQRRADAARKYLAAMGVLAGQVSAISFGDEKPAATGHDEQAWKQNRRDDVDALR